MEARILLNKITTTTTTAATKGNKKSTRGIIITMRLPYQPMISPHIFFMPLAFNSSCLRISCSALRRITCSTDTKTQLWSVDPNGYRHDQESMIGILCVAE